MRNLPTLRQIQYFLALAEHLSFVRAAEACHVTQSTLSGGIKDMESIIGESLFTRSSRGVQLTQAGTALLEPARDLLGRAEGLLGVAGRNRDPLTGVLRMGVIPTIAPYVLPQLLPALQASFPGLQLQLKEDITPRLAEELDHSRLDLLFMAFPYDLHQATKMSLWHEAFFIAAPPPATGDATDIAMTKADPEMVAVESLRGEDILLLDDGHCLRDHAMSACRLQPASRRKTFGATSLPTLIQMVQHGYGMTLLPSMAIEHGIIPPGVRIRRFSNPQPAREIGLAWRKNNPRDKEFRILGDFIVKTLKPR